MDEGVGVGCLLESIQRGMDMRIRSILGKLAVAVLAAMVMASVAHAQQEILIGYHGPLTGPASWVGLGGRDGALLALDEINAAGGVNGRKLRMISYTTLASLRKPRQWPRK